MSNEAITWAYRQPITTGAKFVLVALADMADEAHSCFPGQVKLATMTGQSERTVRRQLAELEVAGYLTRERRFDARGHRTSDRYVLPVNSDVLIPTGQDDRRSEQPAVRMTTGQDGQRSETVVPTGHRDRVTQREPKEPPDPPLTRGRGGNRRRGHCGRHVRYRADCPSCVRVENPPPEKPPWCGECDETTRLRGYDTASPSRCTACHPLNDPTRRTA